jgi:hypothetical protein
MIRLAAFDLDGTLMGGDQRLTPAVRRAVARALDHGVVVTLATGRMFSATLPFAARLNITAPLICYQGGWIQARGGEVLYRIPLPSELARAALELGEAEGWHAVLYADGRLFARELAHPRRFYEALLAPEVTVGAPWAEVLAAHTADKVLFVADPPHIPAMAAALQQRFDGTAEVVQSHERFIEVVPRGVDKGAALAWVAEHLGIPQAEVLAAGDQGNDLSMVRWAGRGVAMGNAIPAVKAAADWIAPPVTEDGAVAILDTLTDPGRAA